MISTKYILYRNWLVEIPDRSPSIYSQRYKILDVEVLDGRENYAIPYVEKNGRAYLLVQPEDIIGPFDTLKEAIDEREKIAGYKKETIRTRVDELIKECHPKAEEALKRGKIYDINLNKYVSVYRILGSGKDAVLCGDVNIYLVINYGCDWRLEK